MVENDHIRQLPDPIVVDERLIAQIQRLWKTRIPLSEALGVHDLRLDQDRLVLEAPLEPNRNHMGTGFAGSLLALASLAGWGVAVALLGGVEDADVVLQNSHARFLHPVRGDLTVRCRLPPPEAARRFLHTYRQRGRARLDLRVDVYDSDRAAVVFEARFAAVRKPPR